MQSGPIVVESITAMLPPTRLNRAWVALAAFSFIASTPARAQQPLADTSVDALVAALRGGPATKSFRRTELPAAGSNLCRGAEAAPNSAPNAAGNERLGRNLEVVPYAGDTTAGVNLSVQFASASDRLTPADPRCSTSWRRRCNRLAWRKSGLRWPVTPTRPGTRGSTSNCRARVPWPCASTWAAGASRRSGSRPTASAVRVCWRVMTRQQASTAAWRSERPQSELFVTPVPRGWPPVELSVTIR